MDPDALPPGVGVGGLGRESSGAAYGAPASTPGAQTRKRKEGQRRTIVAIEGAARLGLPRPALCGGVFPIRAGPRKSFSPMDLPGWGTVPHRRTTRARAPNTPRSSVLEERATLVVGRRGRLSPHNHHHIAPPPPDVIHITLEIGSGRAGAQGNVEGAYAGASTGCWIRR